MAKKQMKKNKHPSGHVIPFRMDAAFFFERAVSYMNRHNLAKALKYFRKACEYEPNNPMNHCNLAGVLAELGRFEESNEILAHVIEHIDQDMTDCYFYMANNFANLGRYDKAEEYAARYLECQPNGEFARDAEEMLEILVSEFGGGEVLRQRSHHADRKIPEQEVAYQLIQEGKFMEATELLKKSIRKNPKAISLQNNLSLAYYYLGQLDKAISIAEKVLAKDKGNIHALCNLAVYSQYLGKEQQLQDILKVLAKLYPVHTDHVYKLASTMGILGQHEEAYRLFTYLCRFSEYLEPSLLHCVAAAAYNLGYYRKARKIWEELKRMDPDHQVASFYLKQAEGKEEGQVPEMPVTYHYQLPFHEQFKMMKEQLQAGSLGAWKQDPLIRSSLFWALRHGDVGTKTQVIQTFALIADQEVERTLRDFIRSPEEMDQLKKLALYVLRQMGVEGPCEAFLNNEKVFIRMQPLLREDMLASRKEWNDVWVEVERKLSTYGEDVVTAARNLWLDYLERTKKHPPRIVKVQSWSAGVAYITLNQLDLRVSQVDIASLFGVSSATVSKVSRRIVEMMEQKSEERL